MSHTKNTGPGAPGGRRQGTLAAVASAAVVSALVSPITSVTAANAAVVGSGFSVTAGDLSFILKQIKIAERHAATLTASDPCGTLVGPGKNQIPDRLTSYGLRTVDGSCNDLVTGRYRFGAADEAFPRLTTAKFRDADAANTFPVPLQPGSVDGTGRTSYSTTGDVVDSQPRVISNLIVDQTSTNPSAVSAAGFPVRAQGGADGIFVCGSAGAPPPPDCVPEHKTLFIPNVTTDVGLSPPYNSLFTFFGQFFDHGVDQTVKSGATVYVPLKADDPLRTLGPDGDPTTNDAVPDSRAFMVLTRAQNQPGGGRDATNTDSPWVDQSQTYTSHASHQVFLREYSRTDGPDGLPRTADDVVDATGNLLGGLAAGQTYPGSADGTTGMATWASTKVQAADKLGLLLQDKDVTNIPLLATDPYGEYIPGPNGLPQYVGKGPDNQLGTADDRKVEGNLANPVPVPADAVFFDTPFLTDIAHNADPSPQDCDHNGTAETTPVADANNTADADFASTPCGQYDNEMLDAHFTAGDGRVNENIALTTIHQIFHSEHDRLVADIKNTLTKPANAALLADYQNDAPNADNPNPWSYGNRLFQAARFVTEMEYQHLVFEEFARKVQPAVRPFHVYNPDVNPAIPAEFAHAVYRFGHSMLNDTVARKDPDGANNSLPLLNAFLNPPEYQHGKNVTLTPEQAAGSIVMGSSDQVGNELDEFVTETLRNNLLGLPLDLPTINMARARDAGVPPLNDLRRQIFAKTGDPQMAPYTDWSDFGNHLKHPESLINFVAAYGQHPTILNASTLAAKRAAAKAIVDPQGAPATDPADIPADAPAFLFGADSATLDACADPAANCTNWATHETGLNQVDLWVGGLAEVTNLFGGLLGSTFNYVFQNTLENLQDHDRFYYLFRTPGMNLRTQLEGNSFSEMIIRNTDGTNTLKADAFATADCKFQLADLNGTPAGFNTSGANVADDPTTDCNENLLLARSPDGTISYKQRNTVDPPGINGQAVYNGSPAVDKVKGGNDNDTFWGDDGNDVIDGQGGDDVALGGNGNDRITDLDGADVLKGGPGNDYAAGGPGDDIFMGGDGQDFIDGGPNDNEAFAGPDTDFVIAGQGADAVFGDGGDDWIQGGSGQDLLQGDHSAPFFDDPAETDPGNEVFVGQVGENDYDAEGGDDLMAQNAAVDRNAGAGGFDWAYHQYDTVGADDDMAINNFLVGAPIQVVVNRDRWQETEADSGSTFNDVIRGTEDVPSVIGGGGFTGCDALDQKGLDRISGLDALVPPLTSTGVTAADVAAVSAAGVCPLTGPVWGQGDILLGAAGSDTIEGRGGDDIIDGDKMLNSYISVRTNPADPTTEIGRTDLMEGVALAGGTFGPNTAGETLQKAVSDGDVDPGNLAIVREITSTPGAADVDRAVFSGPRANYTFTTNADGTTGVDSTTGDLITGIEQLVFTDQTVNVARPAAPTNVAATAGNAQATVTWNIPAGNPEGITSFNILVFANGSPATPPVVSNVPVAGTCNAASPILCTRVVTGLTNGTPYTFQVVGVNQFGQGTTSALSAAVTPTAPVGTAPTVTARTPAVNATNVVTTGNVTATFSIPVVPGGVNATSFTLRRVGTTANVGAVVTYNGTTRVATLNPNANLVPGAQYTATLTGGATAIRAVTGGTPLATTSWTFTTDGTAPTVLTTAPTLTTPLPNATGVSRTANIVTEFSEGMQGIVGANVRLQRVSNGAIIGAVVTQATTAGRTRAIINPNAILVANAQYRVLLTGGAGALRDLSNNPLVTQNRTFTTGAN